MCQHAHVSTNLPICAVSKLIPSAVQKMLEVYQILKHAILAKMLSDDAHPQLVTK